MFGATEILIVLVVALLLFGNRLPALAHSLGLTLNEFRKETSGLVEGLADRGR